MFGKHKLKSIFKVEYHYENYIIRTSNKVEVEQDIMNENKKHFKLASSLPLFNRNILDQIGRFGYNQGTRDLISMNNPKLMNFLQLLHQSQTHLIDYIIDTKR